MKRFFIGLVAAVSLLGCGTATFDAADVKADYRGQINKLTIVLDTTTLEEAFMLGTAGSSEMIVKRRGIMATKYVAAVAAIKEGLIGNFKQAGVEATVRTGGTQAEVTALAAEVRTPQVMTARVVAYMTATTPAGFKYWDSGLSWELAYYDRDRSVNPSNGVVWRTKTGMMMFNFGCDADYKGCGDRFGRSIVDELRRVELLAKK